MKIKTTLITLLAITNFCNAQSYVPVTPPRGLPISVPEIDKDSFNLNFQSITVSNLIGIIFGEVNQKSYVLSNKVLTDERLISFRYEKTKNGDLQTFLSSFLKTLGYQITKQNSVYFVDGITEKSAEDFDYYVYSPNYRTANYLADNLRPYFPENFSASIKQIATDHKVTAENIPPTSPLNSIDKNQEFLSFKYSNDKMKKKILDLINKFDTKEQNLIVKSYIYEVQYNEKDGSAMGLILNLANKKLQLNLGPADPIGNFVKLSSSTLSLFLSNVDVNSNVKLLSNPILRIKNNKETILTVGNSVPVLGNVSYSNQGQAIQNVEYKDTGLVIKLNPTITNKSVSLDLTQEISEAILTSTGVNNTPTLTKRNLKTTFTANKNEVIMLAGLTQTKKTKGESLPFLFPFLKNKNTEELKTDIVIFIEILDLSEPTIPQEIKELL